MATTVVKFVTECYEVVWAGPEYALGHSSLQKCDCIGMVKYGLCQNGVTLTTTGTNWTFRNQVRNVRKITGKSVLQVGDVVFKSRAPGESGYNLPAKYRTGGSAYNGDLNDYCHIGVVASVKPLRIIHMTSPTAKTDTVIGKWKWAAELLPKYIDYSGTAGHASEVISEPVAEPVEQETRKLPEETAVVCAPTGSYVKMRQKPSNLCGVYENVPVGARVTVVAHGYDWTRISYGHRKGWYMMTRFLAVQADGSVS